MNIVERKTKRLKIGPVEQKILLLLQGGLALTLAQRSGSQFRIIKGITKEWKEINRRSLYEAIKKLYQSKMVGYKENNDGTVTLVLKEEGKNRALRYNLDMIEIKKPVKWDGLWRIVIFDIPERFKNERDALSIKLKQLGFYSMQKSVFIYPYECRDEVDFVVEIFNLRPYVRFIISKETDIDLDLKYKFHLVRK